MTENTKQETKFVLSDTVLFDLIVLIFFLLMAIMSFEYNPRARSIPLALGIIGSIMIFLQLLADAIPGLRPRLRFVVQGGILGTEDDAKNKKGAVDAKKASQAPGSEIEKSARYWLQVMRLVLWLVGFVVLLTQVNYLIAVGVFIILITKLEAKETWRKSIILALCIDASFYVLFDLILQAHL
ncbi:MAG: tripartite tricarboxylate transporter TctB family protein [Desulfobacterales bacterium]|nr:tripartite tricarboxylate transporter TctB family protein [Desulfobacterales bacterium]